MTSVVDDNELVPDVDVDELVEEVSYYAKYVLYPIASRIVGLEFIRRAS